MKKKYYTPSVEEYILEDVLADSDLDNIGGDPAPDDNYDDESSWEGLIAD